MESFPTFALRLWAGALCMLLLAPSAEALIRFGQHECAHLGAACRCAQACSRKMAVEPPGAPSAPKHGASCHRDESNTRPTCAIQSCAEETSPAVAAAPHYLPPHAIEAMPAMAAEAFVEAPEPRLESFFTQPFKPPPRS